jgi:ApaG protein
MSLGGLFTNAATSDGVTVRVQAHYLADQSDPAGDQYVWHYHVRIENRRDTAVQLVDRHWIITDGNGNRRDVHGEGVVGEQPLIAGGQAFDYVSGCPLATPSGRMEGSFGMVGAAGIRFRVAIPPFDLVSTGSP